MTKRLKQTLLMPTLILMLCVAGCGGTIGVEIVHSSTPAVGVTDDLITTADSGGVVTPAPVQATAMSPAVHVGAPTETNIPTKPPTAIAQGALALRQALAQGLIEAQIRGMGSAAGDSIIATLTRKVPRTLEITVPKGTVLASNDPTAQDMVVLRVRGIPVGGGKFEPVSTMRLTSDAPQEFLLEAYCLDFDRDNPSGSTGFSVGEPALPQVQSVLEALDNVPAAHRTIGAIQTAIWTVTDDVCERELQARFPVSVADIEAAQDILEAADIEPATTCLLGRGSVEPPQGQKFYLHGEGILAVTPPPSDSSSRVECFFECTQTWAITLTQPLQGNAYGYNLVSMGGSFNVRILHLRGVQQTVLAEWLSRKGQTGGWQSGPQLDAIPGDILTLEIGLPASGSIQVFDYGSNSHVTVGTTKEPLPTGPPPPPPESPETDPHPVLTVGPDNQLHLAWADKRTGTWAVYYARSTDGGASFSTPIPVVSDEMGTARGHPALAMGPGGRVHVAWEERWNGNWDIYCARSDDGETFSSPVQVNDDATGTDQARPALAVGSDGSIFLAWQDSRDGDWDIYTAHSTDGGTSFGANARVNDETRSQQEDPVIGVDGQGRVHVAWADKRSGVWALYYARSEDDGFGQSQSVGSGLIADLANVLPSLAVAPDDKVQLAWANAYIKHPAYGALLYLPVHSATADGGDTFSDPRQVSEGYSYVSTRPPEAGLAAEGAVVHAVLTTYSPRDGSWVWYYRSDDGGQSFGEGVGVMQVEGGDVLHYPAVAADQGGRIHVAWARQQGDEWDVYYAQSSDGGATFSPGWKVIGGETGIELG